MERPPIDQAVIHYLIQFQAWSRLDEYCARGATEDLGLGEWKQCAQIMQQIANDLRRRANEVDGLRTTLCMVHGETDSVTDGG